MRLLGGLNWILKFWNIHIKKSRITNTSYSVEHTYIIYKYNNKYNTKYLIWYKIMKEFTLTVTIHAKYRDSSYYDLKKDKFLEDKSVDDIEEQLAFWLLMYKGSNIDVELIHVDRPTEFAGEDDNQGELHGI